MDEIKGLIKIITNHTKQNLPLLDLKNQQINGNKEMNLFLGIKNGDFNDDSEASKGIYGSQDVDFKFRMLKSRLNRKLLNHLFFMDFENKSFSKSKNLRQEGIDYLYFSRMLLDVGELKLGLKLLYKTLDMAKECEFTNIAIACLMALREVYAKTYRPKLFQNIQRQIGELKILEAKEENANAIFHEFKLFLNSTVNNRKKDLAPFEEAIINLKQVYDETHSFNVYEMYFKLRVWYNELKGDFQEVLSIIEQVESKYEQGQINQKRFDILFAHQAKGNAYNKLKIYDKGAAFLESMLAETGHTSREWFQFAEQLVMLNIQAGKFDKASEIFLRVANNKTFNNLGHFMISRWNVYRSYLYFLTNNKKLIRKFDYKSFIAETPEFSKEKAGYNVALLILQIMQIANGDLTELHHKLNAVDDYVSRYLNNSYSRRTKTFCKLLHKIAIHNRDYDMIISKSKYLQEKLVESDIAGETYVDFEVVPYDFLWTHVLKTIKNQAISA